MSVIDPNSALVVLELDFLLPITKEVLKHKKSSALRVFSVNPSALDMAADSLELKNTDFCMCFWSLK